MLQPTLPRCTFIHTPCMYLQCTGPQWACRRIKAFTSISETGYTGTMKGRVIAITHWGFGQGCLDMT